MSLVIQCPQCSQRYQVAESAVGKQVRCQQCAGVFVAAAASSLQLVAPAASDAWSGVDLSQLPAAPSQAAWTQPAQHGQHARFAAAPSVSNPSGGPTDAQMRLASVVMLVAGVLMLVATVAMERTQGAIFLIVPMLVPLALVLGIAGLISPNVLRAMGKYGGHLPWHYKAIGWGLFGLTFVLMALLTIGLLMVGIEPDRPGARKRRAGLTRAQTTTVIERIRDSHSKSPDAAVVRTATFSVFSIQGSSPEASAERVLAGAPGYVKGSFRLAADGKSMSFQFHGDRAMATQYALLLPGPTGIYMQLQPTAVE